VTLPHPLTEKEFEPLPLTPSLCARSLSHLFKASMAVCITDIILQHLLGLYVHVSDGVKDTNGKAKDLPITAKDIQHKPKSLCRCIVMHIYIFWAHTAIPKTVIPKDLRDTGQPVGGFG